MIVRSLVLITCVLKRFFAKYSTGTVPYGILQCTVRYRYCFMVRANASIPHVMRIIVFTRFFLLQSSLACNASGNNSFLLPAVVGRCLHLAPAYHRCPYPASDRPSSTHHPDMFSIDLWLNVFYVTLRLLVAVPQEDVSKKTSTTGPCTRWDKPSFSPRPG